MGYFLLSGIAVLGLIASAACHVMGWLHLEPPLGKVVFILHIGIFPLWFPLVILANRASAGSKRGNFDFVVSALPKWVGIAAGGLFVYALLNFAYFIYCTAPYPKNKVPFYLELRGFSGHWMMFYGWAAAGFAGLGFLRRRKLEEESATSRNPERASP